MIKKTITYTDYNGLERTEDFYFNLSKAEIAEMQVSVTGGLSAMLQRVVQSNDYTAIFKFFKEFILNSYGVKTEDGRGFRKTPEIRDSFEQTEAYSILLMELINDEKASADFLMGVIPADLSKQVDMNEVKKISMNK